MTQQPSNTNARQAPDQAWTELAAQAQGGDKRAYRELLRAIAPYIKNYIFASLANPEWVEDVVQEVLLSVHRSLKTYSPDRPFKPWLISIINFRRTDYLRKHYSSRGDRQTTLDSVDFLQQHVTNPTHAGEYKDIQAALGTLSDRQRKVFEMFKVQGYSAKEVANEMGMSVSAVKVSIHRSTHKLKEILQ